MSSYCRQADFSDLSSTQFLACYLQCLAFRMDSLLCCAPRLRTSVLLWEFMLLTSQPHLDPVSWTLETLDPNSDDTCTLSTSHSCQILPHLKTPHQDVSSKESLTVGTRSNLEVSLHQSFFFFKRKGRSTAIILIFHKFQAEVDLFSHNKILTWVAQWVVDLMIQQHYRGAPFTFSTLCPPHPVLVKVSL